MVKEKGKRLEGRGRRERLLGAGRGAGAVVVEWGEARGLRSRYRLTFLSKTDKPHNTGGVKADEVSQLTAAGQKGQAVECEERRIDSV